MKISDPSALQLELQYTQRLLACLVYEIEVHCLGEEDAPGDIFDRFASLIQHAPPSVVGLVERLKQNPPQESGVEYYTFSFPFIEWKNEDKPVISS